MKGGAGQLRPLWNLADVFLWPGLNTVQVVLFSDTVQMASVNPALLRRAFPFSITDLAMEEDQDLVAAGSSSDPLGEHQRMVVARLPATEKGCPPGR